MKNVEDVLKELAKYTAIKCAESSDKHWKVMITIRDTTDIDKEKSHKLSLYTGYRNAYSDMNLFINKLIKEL